MCQGFFDSGVYTATHATLNQMIQDLLKRAVATMSTSTCASLLHRRVSAIHSQRSVGFYLNTFQIVRFTELEQILHVFCGISQIFRTSAVSLTLQKFQTSYTAAFGQLYKPLSMLILCQSQHMFIHYKLLRGSSTSSLKIQSFFLMVLTTGCIAISCSIWRVQ